MGLREQELYRLYEALERWGCPKGGPAQLRECQPPAESGVYFFFEPGEERANGDPRIVRVGESGDLRRRLLRNHLNGTHRDNRGVSSRFRRDIGQALIEREGLVCRTWMDDADPSASDDLAAERLLEDRVTSVISAMPVTWVTVEQGERQDLERGIIGLLSNWDREAVDPPSENWLGRYHPWPIMRSGLWNAKHMKTPWMAGLDCAERLAGSRDGREEV
ncbi:MAG: hypothetical protein OXH04_20555 [Acidobacteria bacterium]|nr:hypothetical protein [Acidobacteriota bacterium]